MKPQPRPPRPLTAKAIARAIRKELELVECDKRLRRENIAQHLPAIIAILAQNQNAPLAEALAFEKAIQTYKGNDAATRLTAGRQQYKPKSLNPVHRRFNNLARFPHGSLPSLYQTSRFSNPISQPSKYKSLFQWFLWTCCAVIAVLACCFFRPSSYSSRSSRCLATTV